MILVWNWGGFDIKFGRSVRYTHYVCCCILYDRIQCSIYFYNTENDSAVQCETRTNIRWMYQLYYTLLYSKKENYLSLSSGFCQTIRKCWISGFCYICNDLFVVKLCVCVFRKYVHFRKYSNISKGILLRAFSMV